MKFLKSILIPLLLVLSSATFLAVDYSKAQRMAILQATQEFEAVLNLNLKDKYAVEDQANNLIASIHCIRTNFPEEAKNKEIIDNIEHNVFNTPEKKRKYQEYSASLSGYILKLPKDTGCKLFKNY